MRKTLPTDISYPALFGPHRDRAYFERAGEFPFHDRAAGYDAVNGWWLAEAALLAYVPEEDRVREALMAAGFPDVRFVSAASTHAYSASRCGMTILAFRGTETGDAEDLRTDIDVMLEPATGPGHVHRGFRAALDLIWETVRECLVPPDTEVWFTGHSLGAALATLAANRHPRARALYTFGSPRVGDAAFRDAFTVPTWRVVNNNDFVSRLPPPVAYRHVGERVYIDRHGVTRFATTRLERVLDEAAGHADQAARVFERWRRGDRAAIVWDALVDHSPLHYAIHAWNHLVAVEAAGTEGTTHP